ncbi:MAG: hypothetical protein KKI09_11380 [Spirochaetes bacterium]|nr:hypothetical protein [Spirochaetota bacterium]MBU0956019.1 hypothetical protein [Spirochaetota bacterium]
MIGFVVKHSFSGLWDNLGRLAIINFGFIISVGLPLLASLVLGSIPVLSLFIALAGFFWAGLYLAAASAAVCAYAESQPFRFVDFLGELRVSLIVGVQVAAVGLLVALIVFIVIPFYAGMNSVFGIMIAVLTSWMLLFLILALQFFLPLRAQVGGSLKDIVKKCFLFLVDNTGYCLAVLFLSLIFFLLSLVLVFIMPGPAGILYMLNESLRLRLLKYDYLEAHPGADRRKLPWKEILADEREKAGTRTLRSLIFPWKG